MIKKSWLADSLRDYSSSKSPWCISAYKESKRKVKAVHIVYSAALTDPLSTITVTDDGFNGFSGVKVSPSDMMS